jgi:hypothetical protein
VSGVGAHLARLSFVAFTDPHNARLLWISAGGLFAVGLLLTVGTVLWWRRAGSEHPALAKLEAMGPARRPRPAMAASAPAAGAAAEEGSPVELPGHPSGPVDVADVSADADEAADVDDVDVTAVGEHPAGATDAADDRVVAESVPGIDPLLRPVEASD